MPFSLTKGVTGLMTLIQSRLLRAKRYLEHPVEISFEYDLFGNRTGTRKTLASKPIRAYRVENWEVWRKAPVDSQRE